MRHGEHNGAGPSTIIAGVADLDPGSGKLISSRNNELRRVFGSIVSGLRDRARHRDGGKSRRERFEVEVVEDGRGSLPPICRPYVGMVSEPRIEIGQPHLKRLDPLCNSRFCFPLGNQLRALLRCAGGVLHSSQDRAFEDDEDDGQQHGGTNVHEQARDERRVRRVNGDSADSRSRRSAMRARGCRHPRLPRRSSKICSPPGTGHPLVRSGLSLPGAPCSRRMPVSDFG